MLSITQNKKKQKITNINKVIKVEIPAGGAAVTPPLGPVLGQYGMNTMEFCKEFNDGSLLFEKETIIPTVIYLALDKSFYFELRSPGVAYFIKKYIESNGIVAETEKIFLASASLINLETDIAQERKKAKVKKKGKASALSVYKLEKRAFLQFLYEVALFKMTLTVSEDVKKLNLSINEVFMQNTIRSMLGTARSFGIKLY